MLRSFALITLLTILFMSSCGSRQPTPTAPRPTATLPRPDGFGGPGPTSTLPPPAGATPAGELGGLLFQPGDLPEGLQAGEVVEGLPADALPGVPRPRTALQQRLTLPGGDIRGNIGMLIFDATGDLARAFEALRATLGPQIQELDGIGERGAFAREQEISSVTSVLFIRCAALVSVTVDTGDSKTDALDPQAVLAYSARLDARIQPRVCR